MKLIGVCRSFKMVEGVAIIDGIWKTTGEQIMATEKDVKCPNHDCRAILAVNETNTDSLCPCEHCEIRVEHSHGMPILSVLRNRKTD